jgi:TfoX/Sxy family transcriptional regulator of competence genes
MASQQSIVDYIVEQLAGAEISARKMFGEYGLFRGGKMVALVCDDQLYVKPTAAGRALVGSCAEGPPYPGAKPHLLIAAERWEDAESLTELILVTDAALPAPKTKPRKFR